MKECEEYRAAIDADPTLHDGHAADCAPCRAWRDEVLAFDDRLRLAMRLPVPPIPVPDFGDHDESGVIPLPKRRGLGRPAWLAMAATLVLAAFLTLRFLPDDTGYDSLATQVLVHIDHEPYALRVTDAAVSDATLRSVVPADIATLHTSLGLVTYAQSCTINGRRVPHLVIQGERGPVTLLLMADERLPRPMAVEGDRLSGVILPVGSGSIAIVGERGERLDRLTKSVMRSVTFTT